MKSNKLMIGDWVIIAHGGNATHYAKVTALLTSGTIECLLDGCGVICKSVEPIPITPEILEKNGFKSWEHGYIWKEIVGMGGQTTSASSPIEIILYEGGHSVIMNPHDGKEFQGSIDNVHELQHTLRLCGIEKEIVL